MSAISYFHWLKDRGIRFPMPAIKSTPIPVPTAEPEPDLYFQSVQCQRCPYGTYKPGSAWGQGHMTAKLLIIGDFPSWEAASLGRAFCHNEHLLLERMMTAIGLNNEDLYSMNLLQCPGKKTPLSTDAYDMESLAESFKQCQDFYHTQTAKLKAEFGLLLGKQCLDLLFDQTCSFEAGLGTWHTYKGIQLMVTYHPRDLLRAPELKHAAWQHLQALQAALASQ